MITLKAIVGIFSIVRKRKLSIFFSDAIMTLFEAFICIVFIHLPLIMTFIWKMVTLRDESSTADRVVEIFLEAYTPADVMTFTAGLLAGSTAYFILNIKIAA